MLLPETRRRLAHPLRVVRARRLSLLFVFAMAMLAGCHGARAAALPTSVDGAEAARRAADVPVAVGDRILVRVWRERDFSDSVTVDERGEAVLPRLGPVPVAGRPIGSLQPWLRQQYAQWLRDPVVTVAVLRRVGVQGEVRAPALYFVDATKSLREVLAEAGGITEAGDPNDVVIVREGRRIPLGRWDSGVPLAADLRSGDQVVVGRRNWFARNALATVSTLGFVVSVAVQVLRK